MRPGSVVGLGSRDVGRVGSRTRQERPRLSEGRPAIPARSGVCGPEGECDECPVHDRDRNCRGAVAAVVPAWVAGASTPAVGVRVLTQRALRPHQRGLTCGDAVGEAGVRVDQRILTWGDAYGVPSLRVNQRILTRSDACGRLSHDSPTSSVRGLWAGGYDRFDGEWHREGADAVRFGGGCSRSGS